jgi:very-short-patch-repair endonuclease
MEIVKAFQDDMKITIRGSYEEPLFRASDIGNVLEIANIRTTIKDFDATEKVSSKICTTGGPQNVSFLTVKGLKKLICNSRKPKAIVLAKILNIDMMDIFYIPLESSLIHFLQEVYDEEELIQQYDIKPYKIDLYFPKYNLAIECDEYFHIFQKEDDIKRENYIKEKLGCQIIRFTQDKKNKHLPKLLSQINKIIKNYKEL